MASTGISNVTAVPIRRELAVEIQGLAKFYGETAALDGADLSVTAGTVHGLVGPNGAGKTTLLAACSAW